LTVVDGNGQWKRTLSMANEIKLQPLKENVESVEVNEVKVTPGDTVAKDQPLLEVQADKATLEVNAPMAGRVAKVLVNVGDTIKVGQVYCVIEGANGEAAPPAPAKKKSAASAPPPPAPTQRRPSEAAPTPRPQPVAVERPAPAPPVPAGDKHVPASPGTRQLARKLGIDLRQVHGTGRHGRVVEEDINAYVRALASGTAAPVAAVGGAQPPPLPKFEEWGPVEPQPLTPVRKATARQMSLAWGLIPHVTQHDKADVTELEAFRKQQEARGTKLTVTAFALKAAAIVLKEFPTVNSSLDLAGNRLVLKRYYHIGVAVDTEGGLLVPVLRDVDRKSVQELAGELAAVAQRARDKKLDPNELKGGTFTITNLGGIGGTAFTPIVNWPEVAILGLSRGRLQPVVKDGAVVPRLLLPLSLSYDHRVIDGAAAARFTRRLADLLENPLQMLLHA
jgi:pyruvate dehydrogenase E2 component (dihydrolipoamide acetyltransferase)